MLSKAIPAAENRARDEGQLSSESEVSEVLFIFEQQCILFNYSNLDNLYMKPIGHITCGY